MTWERALKVYLGLQLLGCVAGAVYGWRRSRPVVEESPGFEAVLTVPPEEIDIDEFMALMEFVHNNQIGGDEPFA